MIYCVIVTFKICKFVVHYSQNNLPISGIQCSYQYKNKIEIVLMSEIRYYYSRYIILLLFIHIKNHNLLSMSQIYLRVNVRYDCNIQLNYKTHN